MEFNLRRSALFLILASQISSAAPKSVEAPLKNQKGATIGEVEVTQLKQGVQIEIDAHGLPPGELAFHIHENGKCVGPDFKSAGEHFSPLGNKHGFDAPGGPHSGDMPNLIVAKDGTVHTEVINDHVTLTGTESSLLKPGGTSVVIHQKADDYKSQPSGDTGGRLACAEIHS